MVPRIILAANIFPMTFKRILRCISISLFALSFTPCFAQPPAGIKVTMGAEYKLPGKHDEAGFIQLPSGDYLQLSQRNDESLSIQKLDVTGKVLTSEINPLQGDPKNCETQAVINLGQRVWWFYSVKDKRDAPGSLLAQEIDAASCKLTGSKITLATDIRPDQQDDYYRYPQLSITRDWQFTKSPDNSKLLVWCKGDSIRRTHINASATFFVFDDHLEKIWQVEAKLPYAEAKYRPRPYALANDGTVYTTAAIFNEDKNFLQAMPSRFEVLKWTKGQPVAQVPVSLPGRLAADAIVVAMADGSVYVGGCYARARTQAVEGLFLYLFDPVANALKPLSDSSLYSYRHLKIADNDRGVSKLPPAPTLTIMRMRGIRKADDGSVYLLAQEQYDEIFSSGRTINPSGPGMHSEDFNHPRAAGVEESTVHHFDDIAVACVKPDGRLKWMAAIPQKHAGRGVANSLTFGSYLYNNNCYLVYLSNRRNLKRDESDDLKQHMDGADDAYLTVATISPEGVVTKQTLMEENDDRKNFDVGNIHPTGAQKILVRGYEGHLEKTDKLQLDVLELSGN